MSSLVCVTAYIKAPVTPGGRFPPILLNQVIIAERTEAEVSEAEGPLNQSIYSAVRGF